jgi:hypothetical protein
LHLQVPFVCGTDYFEANQFIEYGYQLTASQSSGIKPLKRPQFNFDQDKFHQIVWNQRSIRRFRKQFISQEDYLYLWGQIVQPIPTENCEEIEIYAVVH